MEIPTEHDADDISRWIKTYGKQARIAAQRCQSAHGELAFLHHGVETKQEPPMGESLGPPPIPYNTRPAPVIPPTASASSAVAGTLSEYIAPSATTFEKQERIPPERAHSIHCEQVCLNIGTEQKTESKGIALSTEIQGPPPIPHNTRPSLVTHFTSIASSAAARTRKCSAPPVTDLNLANQGNSARDIRKYYVVTRGRCVGIFDSWAHVQAVTNGVSSNCHKSYPTYEEAWRTYQDAKVHNLVQVIRTIGDEDRFGPDELAMQ